MKGNIFQGTATGKVGNTVFYRRNGEQCARVYVKPKVSYSLPNLKVRCRFASANNAWHVFKQAEISAMQRTEKDNANNLFVKYNFPIAPYQTKEENKMRLIARQAKIAPYIVSWGTLSNIWEPITSIYPYASVNGQQKTGLTLRFLIDYDPINAAFAGREEEGAIQSSLGYIVTAIASYFGSRKTHLGLFAAYGPEPDDFGYFYNRFAYAELWDSCPIDIPCTVQWAQNEHRWNVTFNGSATIMGWSLTATYDNPGFTITYATPDNQPQGRFLPCAATTIAVKRGEDGRAETSKSQLIMQDWMDNPYQSYIDPGYSAYAAETFRPESGEYIDDNQLICGPD